MRTVGLKISEKKQRRENKPAEGAKATQGKQPSDGEGKSGASAGK